MKAIGTIHAPSSRISVHAFADGLVYRVGHRFLAHGFIVLLIAAVALTSGFDTTRIARASAKSWKFEPFPTRSFSTSQEFIAQPVVFSTIPGATPVPAAKPKRATDAIATYEVAPGDTMTGIAERFGVSVETILSANNLADADSLGIGDKLSIPAVSGIVHTVRSGDTLDSLAIKYEVTSQAIIESEYNNLSEPYLLSIGQKLIVPGGKMPPPPPPAPIARAEVIVAAPPATTRPPQAAQPPASTAPPPPPAARGGQFIWPTTGQITQGYSYYHGGIDIAPPYGTPIYASNSGAVISVQYLTYDWGWNLVIDHGGGLMSRYAHVSKFLVSQGQQVSRGQPIALVGSTGRSTGPHLHFEIYQNGARVNPMKYLP